MKNITIEQAQTLIQLGAITLYDTQGNPLRDSATLWELNDIAHLPKYLQYYYYYDKKTQGYLLPEFILEFDRVSISKHKSIFLQWLKEAKKTYQNQEKKDLVNLQKISRQLISILVTTQYVNSLNICEHQFWDKSFNINTHQDIKTYKNIFLSLFENENDVIHYSQILPLNFLDFSSKYFNAKKFKTNLQYQIYLSSLQLVKDYSLVHIPPILMERKRGNSSDKVSLEVLKALKKYDISLIKDTIFSIYARSNHSKVIESAKEILISHELYKQNNELFTNFEEVTKYYIKIEINFIALKQKVQDNMQVSHTLLAFVSHYLSHDFQIQKKNNALSVEFEATSLDKNELSSFKIELEKCILFAFDHYLSPDLFKKFSQMKNGAHIFYENKREFQQQFSNSYKKFLLQSKLDKNMPKNNLKINAKKI